MGSIPSTALVLNESQPSDKRRIDCKILYAITGLYTFNLVVSDAYGASDSASIEVVVLEESAQNQPPVADAGPVIAASIPHDGIPGGFDTFDLVSESTDDCDDEGLSYLTCEWTNLNGPYFYSNECETTVDLEASDEEYIFELTVTDPYGLTSTDTKFLFIALHIM